MSCNGVQTTPLVIPVDYGSFTWGPPCPALQRNHLIFMPTCGRCFQNRLWTPVWYSICQTAPHSDHVWIGMLKALGFMANSFRQMWSKEKALWYSCGLDVACQACFVFSSTVYIVPQVTDPDMRGNLLLIRPVLDYFQRRQRKSHRRKHTSSPNFLSASDAMKLMH